MTFRILTASLTVLALGTTAPVSASPAPDGQSQSKPDPKPEPKADPKPAASIAGKWSMNIETPGGARPATLDFKLDGRKVTGTISSEVGETPVTGEFAEGKLTFSITIDANGQSLSIGFTGAAQKDGSLAGSADMAGQAMNWTATRIKETPLPSLTGKWAMTLEVPTGTASPSLEIVQDGPKISGSYQGRYGKFPIAGTLTERTLVFTFTMNAEGQEVVMTFTTEVAADGQTMKGTADMPGLGEATWSAKREKEK